MYRSTLTALAMTGFLAFGCEQKTETEKAAETNAENTVKKIEEAKEKAQAGTGELNKNAEGAGEAMQNQAGNAAEATKDGAANVQSEINSLASKAQDAVKAGKWSEAETHVSAIDTLKAKLPEGARKPIDDMLTEVRSMIQKGKSMPAMPH
ncbi:MAG TPA: hypothetical protein VF624_08685 [Tepidisphaeraceae bacterium]|jgi:phenylalanyl-tRNA synthetase alpha subunit